MRKFVDRWLWQLVVGLGVLALAGVSVGIVSMVVASSARDDAEELRVALAASEGDVERLREAVRDFVGEAQALQDQLTGAGPAMSQALAEAVAGLETFSTSTIEFDVAIRDTVSVDTTFETTILVDTPVGLDIPVDVRVPLKVDLPVALTVTIPIKETIPIEVDVPIEFDVPVKLDVGSTELGTLTDALAGGLESLEVLLSALDG